MRNQITEIYWIRVLACLSVVFIHVLTRIYNNFELNEFTNTMLKTIQVFFMFATPMFVMIFEVVLASVYSKNLPKNFIKKRFLYLLMPFITVPFLYGIYYKIVNHLSWEEFRIALIENILLATWHGYFIIIILQFVVIHTVYVKWLHHVKVWKMLVITFIINGVYLYLVNFQIEAFPTFMQNWFSLVRVPFFGWIFYFTVAYYVGRNLREIKKHRAWGLPFSVMTTIICGYTIFLVFKTGLLIEVSSMRLDIILYTISLFFVFLYTFSYIQRIPKLIRFINNYSFPIYLLHFLAFNIGDLILPELPVGIYGISMFIMGILFSVWMAKIINILPIGQFIVGKVNKVEKDCLGEKIERRLLNRSA
ncbi:acyltransferase family protein [Sutcliffiella halmapala]|uniref:acyltransferase family protein n=1 Tax=Sutcliffiella halmapala TaxID=79882 RepID=UPI0009958F33|nr:acyltransferase family protein [Sutcliffiella halmapala]